MLPYKLVDLTHAIHPEIPTWDQICGFSITRDQDYVKGPLVHAISCQAGIGTHIDAPMHFVPGAKSVADIPIEDLVLPVIVIDVSSKADASYQITETDIHEFEQANGEIDEGTFVIGCTGWSQYWGVPNQYRNLNEQGELEIPGFTINAAEYLLSKNIAGVGIDTLSPDGGNLDFPVHHLFLGANKFIVENLTNVEQVPGKGAHIMILPMKMQDVSEAPARVVALI
tara:strand:+ start:14971 stop:15648 length:678 start_codon:yes stop_codon:yes gene_type:complete